MIKAILIDVDNTLLDFNKCAKESMKMAFEDFGLTFQEEMFERFTEINNYLWKELENEIITKEDLLDVRWNMIFKQCGIEYDGRKFEKRFEELLAESHQPVEGALEMLQYLSSKYDVYVATNGFTNAQINRIALAGMKVHVHEIFVSESIGYSKPNEEFFEYCFSKIGNVEKDEVIIIGDSLTADIIGGINYGIHTCWYNHTGEKQPSEINMDYKIEHLNGIIDIL